MQRIQCSSSSWLVIIRTRNIAFTPVKLLIHYVHSVCFTGVDGCGAGAGGFDVEPGGGGAGASVLSCSTTGSRVFSFFCGFSDAASSTAFTRSSGANFGTPNSGCDPTI